MSGEVRWQVVRRDSVSFTPVHKLWRRSHPPNRKGYWRTICQRTVPRRAFFGSAVQKKAPKCPTCWGGS